jgi:ATP-binding cassette subfamily C (CFTR/MRP) protein 4
MIHGLVRCPSAYFDTTPTGRLINKFSNDLGILDNTLSFVFFDMIEGPIITIIMLINIFQINVLFIPPGALSVIFLIFFFMFCKCTIIESKQLDLRTRTPVFNIFGEMISGLIQVRLFGRRKTLLQEFSDAVNAMTRSNICYWNCSRGFGTYVSYFSILTLIIGYLIGVYNSTPQTAGLYGVSVVFLVQINDYLQWFLRQIIVMESIMVSV